MDGSTGATITITSPVSRVYTVVRKGDVDADNDVDGTDSTKIKNTVLCQDTITDTAKQAAADFNHDGVIDGFDYNYMALYTNGVVSD